MRDAHTNPKLVVSLVREKWICLCWVRSESESELGKLMRKRFEQRSNVDGDADAFGVYLQRTPDIHDASQRSPEKN